MELRLNGEQRSADVDPRMLLVEALRDAFGARGPKIGCLTGDCGACTVRVDGAIVKSCLKLAVAADTAIERTSVNSSSPHGPSSRP
jgi:aerobic-type carbon monoxide dehydrogenase small subunit (CoxS/CutS family)